MLRAAIIALVAAPIAFSSMADAQCTKISCQTVAIADIEAGDAVTIDINSEGRTLTVGDTNFDLFWAQLTQLKEGIQSFYEQIAALPNLSDMLPAGTSLMPLDSAVTNGLPGFPSFGGHGGVTGSGNAHMNWDGMGFDFSVGAGLGAGVEIGRGGISLGGNGGIIGGGNVEL